MPAPFFPYRKICTDLNSVTEAGEGVILPSLVLSGVQSLDAYIDIDGDVDISVRVNVLI